MRLSAAGSAVPRNVVRGGCPLAVAAVALLLVLLMSGTALAEPTPSNDDFANRIALESDNGSLTTSTKNATFEDPNEPSIGGYGGMSIWYEWTPSVSRAAIIDLQGSDFDTTLAVFKAGDGGVDPQVYGWNMDQVAWNDDLYGMDITPQSRASFAAQAGVTYYIQVDGYGVSGNVQLAWSMQALPTNDRFANRATLSGTNGTVNGDTFGASLETNEPYYYFGGQSIWYQWTPSAAGAATFTTNGSDFNSVLTVYKVASGVVDLTVDGWNLFQLDQNDDWNFTGLQARVWFEAQAGATYYIQVDGSEGSGNVTLSWAQPAEPANDAFASRTVLSGDEGTTLGWNAFATLETNEPLLYSPVDYPNISGTTIWYEWTPKGTADATIDLQGSDFDTTLQVFQAGALGVDVSADGWNLTLVASNDDFTPDITQSQVIFPAVAGATYYIQVDGWGETGDLEMTRSLAGDTTPAAIPFTPVTGAALSAEQVSNTVSISGINVPTLMTVSPGSQYRIGAGSWTSAPGVIANGSSVAVKHTSSDKYSTTVTTTLSVGTVNATFSSTTMAAGDTTPNPFTFTAQTGVPLSSLRTSNTVTITGINTGAAISVTGGQYQIGSGAWVSTSGTVTSGQTVTVRHTSSASYSTPVTTTLTIGGVVGTFRSTTLADPRPTVTGLSVHTGSTTGGTPVTLTGTKFTGATSVKFGGVAATGVTVVSATSITCKAPAHVSGAFNVTVTAPSGTSVAAAGNAFTYTLARYQENNVLLSYYTAWTTSASSTNYSGSYQKTRNAPGAALTFKFTGVGFRLLATKGTAYGQMTVKIDGVAQPTINLNASSTTYRNAVLTRTGLANTTHTVVLDYYTGNAPGKLIGLDQIDIDGTMIAASSRYQENNLRIYYPSAWTTSSASTLYSGSYQKTKSAAGALTFKFTGTGFRVVCTKGKAWGKMKVTIDGVVQPTLIDLYWGSSLYQQIALTKTGMTNGIHTIKLDWANARNSLASSTKVNLDALDIYGTLLQAP